jgi:hypothetical protein
MSKAHEAWHNRPATQDRHDHSVAMAGRALAARQHAALDVEPVQSDDRRLGDVAVVEDREAVALAVAALAVAHELERLELAERLEELPAERLVKVVRQAAEEDLQETRSDSIARGATAPHGTYTLHSSCQSHTCDLRCMQH